MKMSKEHFEALKAAIVPLDTPQRRQKYLSGDFPRADKCRDLNKRYRWDLLWAIGLSTGTIYAYLNDDHIDTALRAIVKPL